VKRRQRLQTQILLLAFATATPALLATVILLLQSEATSALKWTAFLTTLAFTIGGAFAVRQRATNPLRSLASMVEALRKGDYAMRPGGFDREDAIGEAMHEIGLLGNALHRQRLQDVEAGVLLDKLIAEVDIAVFAFDGDRGLTRINRAGEALFNRAREDLKGLTAIELGLDAMLDGNAGGIVSHEFPAGSGRWEVRHRRFRQDGKPQELLVISDLSRALREEERLAWRRLVRVMGHELNSSLAPIKSIAATLRKRVNRTPVPSDWIDDANSGLAIIHERAGSLERFMGAYAQLARLPAPDRREVTFAPIAAGAAALFGDRAVVEGGTDVSLEVDRDQIQQVLINLIKNGVEAMGTVGTVRVRWRIEGASLIADIEDDGPGLARTDSLWVPFFTTKPGGSGIGLVLSREIVENHGGTVSLRNRETRGCVASLTLPLGSGRATQGSA
jgi:two-component system, NtrC family, nitrogen regulation sensor histidine kinase NtrY